MQSRVRYYLIIALFLFLTVPVLGLDLDDAKAAYSVREINADYTGPVLEIQRVSDGATTTFSFQDGELPEEDIESWLGGSDGKVRTWYSQIPGHPALVAPDDKEGPVIADDGQITKGPNGKPELQFTDNDALVVNESLPEPLQHTDHTLYLKMRQFDTSATGNLISLSPPGSWPHLAFYGVSDEGSGVRIKDWNNGGGGWIGNVGTDPGIFIHTIGTDESRSYLNHELVHSRSDLNVSDASVDRFVLGASSKSMDTSWNGSISEVVLTGYSTDYEAIRAVKDDMVKYYETVPMQYNPDALLTQRHDYNIKLYNWLANLTVDDVTLPDKQTPTETSIQEDALPDVWMQLEGLTVSSVVRGEPEWYVLDAGNGKGIEATGEVRLWNEPRGGSYGGNPPRAWANEPAFIYQLDIPLENGGQGNPYYKEPALCRRALAVAITDMNQFQENWGIPNSWGDMYGKAMLSWGETYRWCKEVLSDDVQQAYEQQMEFFLEKMATGKYSPRGANSNMDMFAIHGAADFAAVAESDSARQDALRGVKRYLFGYPDGELGSKHRVLEGRGLFDPSGFIMEGKQPDVFYGGESMYHIVGAVSALQDRDTGEMPQEWQFLKEVLQRLQDWRTYQLFYDPLDDSWVAGAGMSGRTGAGVPKGQAGEVWKSITLGAILEDHAFKAWAPDYEDMRSDAEERMSMLDKVSQTYEGTPPTWSGWSPWAKKNPYLPATGWHDRLSSRTEEEREPPIKQAGTYYNKVFGGYPVGNQYWSYKDTTGEREFGWFVEAQPKQGPYGGWFGGKIETFWTNTTGSIIVNRHGKTGCDRSGPDSGGSEDSTCWWNLDSKAGHHVWGRDENGEGFTTLLLRGKDLERTSEFDDGASPTQVTVRNVFNDGVSDKSNSTGEQSAGVLEEETVVKNTIRRMANGIQVEHDISGTGDEVTELWASLPIYRGHSPAQGIADPGDTLIEYWDGEVWRGLPIGGSTPPTVTTKHLRLTRNVSSGSPYMYITLSEETRVRLAQREYKDPYQTDTVARTVHFDLLGSATTMPNTELTYNITTEGPGFSSSKPVVYFDYPSYNGLLPAGGTWTISTKASWPNAQGTTDYQYSTDYAGDEAAATWQMIAEETGGKYVGGTIPTGVQALRAVAETGSTTVTTVRDVTPAQTSLILRDDFEADTGPIEDHEPTFGNLSYQNIKGKVVVQNGTARQKPGWYEHWGETVVVATDTNDVIVKANVTYGGWGEGHHTELISGLNEYYAYYGAQLLRNSVTLRSRRPDDSGKTEVGLQTGTPYEFTLQHIGDSATAVLYNGSTRTTASYIGIPRGYGSRQGFRIRKGGRILDLSIYEVKPASNTTDGQTDPPNGTDAPSCTFEEPATPGCSLGSPSNVSFDGTSYQWLCDTRSCQATAGFTDGTPRMEDKTITDTVIYGTAYTSSDGDSWNQVSLNTDTWTVGNEQLDVDSRYVAFYSCSWNEGWDCHDGWQLVTLNGADTGEEQENDTVNQSEDELTECKGDCQSLSTTISPLDSVDAVNFQSGNPSVAQGPDGEVLRFTGEQANDYAGASFKARINLSKRGVDLMEKDLLKLDVKASRGAFMHAQLNNHPEAGMQSKYWFLDGLRGPFDWRTIHIDLDLPETFGGSDISDDVNVSSKDQVIHISGSITNSGRAKQEDVGELLIRDLRAAQQAVDVDWDQTSFTTTETANGGVRYTYPVTVTNKLNQSITTELGLEHIEGNRATGSVSQTNTTLGPGEATTVDVTITISGSDVDQVDPLYTERFKIVAQAASIQDSQDTILRSADPIYLPVTVPLSDTATSFPIMTPPSALPDDILRFDASLARSKADGRDLQSLIDSAKENGIYNYGDSSGSAWNDVIVASAYLYEMTGEEKYLDNAETLLDAAPEIWDAQYQEYLNQDHRVVSDGILAEWNDGWHYTLGLGWRLMGTQRSPYQFGTSGNNKGGSMSSLFYAFDMLADELDPQVREEFINDFAVPAGIQCRNHYIGDGNQQATVDACALYAGLAARNWPLVAFAHSSEHGFPSVIEWTFTDDGTHIRDGYQDYTMRPLFWNMELMYGVGINSYAQHEDRLQTLASHPEFTDDYFWNWAEQTRLN